MGARISRPLQFPLPPDQNELTQREEIFIPKNNVSLSENYINDEFMPRRYAISVWSTDFTKPGNSAYIGQIV